MSRIKDIDDMHERTNLDKSGTTTTPNQELSARTHETGKMHYDSGFESGVEFERKRIIKLLEPKVNRHHELGLDASAAYLKQTIELIKGRQ
jgi:hypothetical protein